MQERFFPIGIQTFEEIRRRNAIYVDKTEMIYSLAKSGKYFFARTDHAGQQDVNKNGNSPVTTLST